MGRITITQERKMAKIFLRSRKTFQCLAEEAGLSDIPDHLTELSSDDARKLLKYCGPYLSIRKEKKKCHI